MGGFKDLDFDSIKIFLFLITRQIFTLSKGGASSIIEDSLPTQHFAICATMTSGTRKSNNPRAHLSHMDRFPSSSCQLFGVTITVSDFPAAKFLNRIP